MELSLSVTFCLNKHGTARKSHTKLLTKTQAVVTDLVLVDEDIPQFMLSSELIPVAVIDGNLCKFTGFLEFDVSNYKNNDSETKFVP